MPVATIFSSSSRARLVSDSPEEELACRCLPFWCVWPSLCPLPSKDLVASTALVSLDWPSCVCPLRAALFAFSCWSHSVTCVITSFEWRWWLERPYDEAWPPSLGLSSPVKLLRLAVEFRDTVDAAGPGRPDRRFPTLARCCLWGTAVPGGSSVSSDVALTLGVRLCGSATKAAASWKAYVSSRLQILLQQVS